MMTASVAYPAAVTQIAWPLAPSASVVGRNIFYNNSHFDGNDPAANQADDKAIAVDKTALLPGTTATFANYTSFSGGINGVMIDVANLAGTPTADDFVFQVGNNNDPRTWTAAPAPSSIAVRQGAGAGGSARITITWPDDAIMNQWLQVDVRATASTGLARPDVFYFGNAIGESGDNPLNAFVDVIDQLAARNSRYELSDSLSIFVTQDYNRDGLISPADELLAHNFSTGLKNSLQLITPDATASTADILGRWVFYNNSQFDAATPGPAAADDGAIATDKVPLLPGGTASFANYTSFSRGLNGIMLDVAGLQGVPTASDFDFRVGNDNNPSQWTVAPSPSSISVRPAAGVGGSSRVTIIWLDGAIQKQWLQVTVKPTVRTGLTKPDVFYFGNAVGETGDSTTQALVTNFDALRVHAAIGPATVDIDSLLDINRDRRIDAADETIVGANLALNGALKLIDFAQNPLIPPSDEVAFTDFVSAQVVSRNVFYNNSSFDGLKPAADAADDLAIATDKSALLPGGTATLANYTSYSRGINGIMVDIAGLPATPTAADFLFRVGNSSDPSQWISAPAPRTISVRQGAGLGGSDRITIIWPDDVIERQWLQVTVKAGGNTGLAADDVFYFGNAIGESGNTTADTRVDSTDTLAARNSSTAPGQVVPISASVDFNRDGLIDAADQRIAQRNATTVQSVLQLIRAPALSPAPPAERETVELFHRGDGGINVFFAPNLVKTSNGSLLAIAEGRTGEDDNTGYALALRRSNNGGQSWSPISLVYSITPYTTNYIGNPSAVVDAVTGQVFVLFACNNNDVLVTSSSDDGQTWSKPSDITAAVKVTTAGNPNPSTFPSQPWGWYATGPGHGIQLQQGPFAGRLLIACDHRLSDDRSGPSWSHVIYSDDHGMTWHLGGGLDQTDPANDYSNECSLVEQTDGTLYMSVRLNDGSAIRGYARSIDGGMSWTTMGRDSALTTYGVEASLLRVNANTVLLSAPDSTDSTRHQMTLWISHDNMQTWSKTTTLYYGYSGYSDMVLVGPDTVLLAYNRGHVNDNSWQSVGLVRVNLRWLTSAATPQFTWNFNEELPGTLANTLGTSIQDSSAWDNRAQAQAASPAEAPRYVAGPGGNRALSLTSGSDSVVLTPPATNALQFGANESFTVEITLRTSDSTGVIIGARPGVRGWTVQLVGGLLRFTINDGQTSASITSNAAINDGNWHRVALVRDAVTYRLSMTIDGVSAATSVVATTTRTLASNDSITLGAYNDGSAQLAFDVDTLRVTRGILTAGAYLPANYIEPPLVAPPATRPDAPSTLAGLQLWLPAYDYSRDFADLEYSDPVPLAPVSSTAVRSVVEASLNRYHVSVGSETNKVLVANDSTVGTSWLHKPLTTGAGQPWIVHDSNGTSATNFDFVQNTGVFTLSTFVKAGSFLSNTVALFDNADTTSVNAGFTLMLSSTGSLSLLITAGNGSIRIYDATSPGLVSPGAWYQIAVVGNGPGKPVQFYVTPVGDPTVNLSLSSQMLSGNNGIYPTDAAHDLTIGSLANGYASFNGQMVDQAIYNRALSAAEIQQLFDYTIGK